MIAFKMFNLFALMVTGAAIETAGYPRKASVQGIVHLLLVTRCQLHILLNHNNTNRAVKQGRESQLDDITCINSKYKAIFIVQSGLEGNRILEQSYSEYANHTRWPVNDFCRPTFPV
jgi:hypothetical protein